MSLRNIGRYAMEHDFEYFTAISLVASVASGITSNYTDTIGLGLGSLAFGACGYLRWRDRQNSAPETLREHNEIR